MKHAMIGVGDRVKHRMGKTPGVVVREIEWTQGSGAKRFEVLYDNGLRATVGSANLRMVEKRSKP